MWNPFKKLKEKQMRQMILILVKQIKLIFYNCEIIDDKYIDVPNKYILLDYESLKKLIGAECEIDGITYVIDIIDIYTLADKNETRIIITKI